MSCVDLDLDLGPILAAKFLPEWSVKNKSGSRLDSQDPVLHGPGVELLREFLQLLITDY